MAIDRLSKAHAGQSEIAVMLAGDSDFVDTVQAVRNVGRRVVGV